MWFRGSRCLVRAEGKAARWAAERNEARELAERLVRD
jgi:hypothetical protein